MENHNWIVVVCVYEYDIVLDGKFMCHTIFNFSSIKITKLMTIMVQKKNVYILYVKLGVCLSKICWMLFAFHATHHTIHSSLRNVSTIISFSFMWTFVSFHCYVCIWWLVWGALHTFFFSSCVKLTDRIGSSEQLHQNWSKWRYDVICFNHRSIEMGTQKMSSRFLWKNWSLVFDFIRQVCCKSHLNTIRL